MDELVAIGGIDRKYETSDFTGGKLTVFMGAADIDLRDCQMRPGSNVLDIFCTMGGVDLKVPPHWNVQFEVSPIMGGIDDKRKSLEITNPDSVLVIKGQCIMGGLDIRN